MVLYSNALGEVYQNDANRKLVIKFVGHEVNMCITDFLIHRSKLNRINIVNMLFDLSPESDFYTFNLPKNKLVVNLTIKQILQMKDLVNGAMHMLELKDVLFRNHITQSEIVENSLIEEEISL